LLGLDSYDRFFPNQDTLPKGGFGNLIALPLQWASREIGNSVFIHSEGAPYPDQWQFLSTIKKLKPEEVEANVREASRKNQIIIEKRKSNAMGVSAILKNVNGCLIVLTRTSPFGKGGMRGISSAIKSPLAPLC
jgi:hypothetical protein